MKNGESPGSSSAVHPERRTAGGSLDWGVQLSVFLSLRFPLQEAPAWATLSCILWIIYLRRISRIHVWVSATRNLRKRNLLKSYGNNLLEQHGGHPNTGILMLFPE